MSQGIGAKNKAKRYVQKRAGKRRKGERNIISELFVNKNENSKGEWRTDQEEELRNKENVSKRNITESE